MISPEERSRERPSYGYELSKRLLEAPDDDSAEELVLEAALKVPRAERSWLARRKEDGTLVVFRGSRGDAPSGEEEKLVLEAAALALERHAAGAPSPDDVASPATSALAVIARALPDRARVLGVLVLVRPGEAPFDAAERSSFAIMAHHAAHGLARRRPIVDDDEPPRSVGESRPPSGATRIDGEAAKAKTKRFSREELEGLPGRFPQIVGRGPAHRRLLEQIARFVDARLPVLLLGEPGTGKELVARALHRASARSKAPFAPANLAGIPESLLEAELFGGAGEPGLLAASAGGTVFLDEIDALSPKMQAKLTAVIESTPDLRLIAATSEPLAKLAAQGLFREDLHAKLAALEIRLLPLRARREDLRLLVEHFLRGAGATKLPTFSPEAWTLLETHPFPGNVRQLRRALERARAFGHDPIRAEDLGLDDDALEGFAYANDLVRRAHFRDVVESLGGDLTRAAWVLGVHRNTVARVLGLPRR